jgi:transposase
MGSEIVKVFVGIDIGKEDHYVQALSSSGIELFDQPLRNDQADIESVISRVLKFGDPVVVIDTKASNVQLLLSVTASCNVRVGYVTGLQMRRAADLYAGHAKTDPRDAWVLADYGRRFQDRLAWLETSDDVISELQILNGRDTDLGADATRTRNRCRDALTAVSPALERVIGPKLEQAGIRDLLVKYPTTTALKTVGKTKIKNVIKKRSPRLATRYSELIAEALNAQSLVLPAEQRWGQIIAALINDLENIIQQRKNLESEIEEVYKSHPLSEVLDSLCGFGTRTGARTLAEIGDPNRFENGNRLAAYAGLAPTVKQSGKTINTATRSRSGNHRLKDSMFISAFVASQHDPDAKAYYNKKRDEGKKHNAAIICVARKRCNIILAMLKNQTKYQPEKYLKTG